MKNRIFGTGILLFALFAGASQSNAAKIYNESGGLVIMEAENTDSALGNWETQTSLTSYTGGGHLQFLGNTYLTGPADSPLEYTFKINQGGLYYLHLRAAKTNIVEGAEERRDVANDCYVRVDGDYAAGPGPYVSDGDNAPLSMLQSDSKYYTYTEQATDKWKWEDGYGNGNGNLNPNNQFRVAVYDFKAGETYTLVVSGRSKFFRLDRIVFRHSSASASAAENTSTPESEHVAESYVYDATEDFPSYTNGVVPYYIDGGNDCLGIRANIVEYRDLFARAERTFDGDTGTYDVTITALREFDGECVYRFLVDGEVVGTAQNGEVSQAYDYAPQNHVFRNITIPAGATIAVESNTDTNGKIPEGNEGGTAWARGRWSEVSLTPSSLSIVKPPDGRIALVSDGNSPDPDDIGAKAVFFGILKASGYAERLVHLSHSCDLDPFRNGGSQSIDAENELRRQAKLYELSDEGIAQFGPFINLVDHFNCRSNQTEAVADLTAAIDASTAEDPLWIIEAGEPDVIGYALSNSVESARQHVHIISHHPANDNSGDFWTWPEIQAFGIIEHQIGDQNGGLKSTTNEWDWAYQHPDPGIDWIYQQLRYAEQDGVVGFQTDKFDCSDAGMMYWWLTGADNGGNSNSTPTEIKSMLLGENAPDPVEPPAPTDSDLVAGWDTWSNGTTPVASVFAPNVTASALTTTEGLAWGTGDVRGASEDGTWGGFEGPPVASTDVTTGRENLTLPNATTGATITFTINNTGTEDIELSAFHFDAYAFRHKAPRTYELSVLAGGGITPGVIYTSAAQEIFTNGSWDNGAHDDIDHSLLGLADHTLGAGESVQFLLAFSGGAGDGSGGHHLFVDNVGVTKVPGLAEPPALVLDMGGDDMTFSWTEDGFKVQSRTNLASGVWMDVPGGDVSPVNVLPTRGAEFYRLIEL